MLTHLADVYVQTGGDVKRTILRILEAPIKEIGMESEELLSLVENCPKGSETLVTRIIHILTERSAPSPELVNKVRDLYAKRVADVRFLIPVLNGLTKQEVGAALPKLIKLNPVVVKEVFNRLLGTGSSAQPGAMTPADLMIAIHNIDTTKCDMKTIIKATGLCFQEKSVFTMEVLTIVLQQLMEQKDIPLLLMRTVIQSVALYPNLIGFTMNILQRLIVKQVWKQKMLWEGFIKCCERTKPQSFRVLLQVIEYRHNDSCFQIMFALNRCLRHNCDFCSTPLWSCGNPCWSMCRASQRRKGSMCLVRWKLLELKSVPFFTSFLCQVMEVLYNVPPKESEAEEVGEGIETST